MNSPKPSPVETELRRRAAEAILVLDGAMGTEIQGLKLDEAGYRGTRFADWPSDLRGNNDMLILSQPDAVRELHLAYLRAGADIVSTNTFSSTRIAQADYGAQEFVPELNVTGARLAKEAAAIASREDGRPRFVAGAIGPTNRTASISPDVGNPGFRAISFDELREAYGEQAKGLLEGGADILLLETVFDTLNAKAALYAFAELFEARGGAVPVMVSGTITDLSGRMLSGQTPEAFWISVRHAAPFTIGLNCALGAKEMRAHIADLARIADTLICAYPNAGLPNEFGLYDESPEYMAGLLAEFAEAGLVNIVGGCCGTTPDHICAIAEAVRGKPPRRPPDPPSGLRLSGLEPFVLTPDIPFVNVGERTNVTGSARFRKLITAGDYPAALSVARDQVENGAQVIDVNMDEGLLDSEHAMTTFLNLVAAEPDIAKVPVMVDSSKFKVIEAGLKCIQGKSIVNSISLKEGEAEFIRQAQIVRRARRRRRGDGVRRAGPSRYARAQDRRSASAPTTSSSAASAFRPTTSSSIPTSSPSPPASRSTMATASPISRRRSGSGKIYPAHMSPAASPISPSPSAAMRRCARPCIRCSSITPSRPGWTWASSMPGRWRSMTTSSRSCVPPARTSCATSTPMPPTACSPSPAAIAARAATSRPPISPGATGRSTSASPMRSSTASPTTSKPMWRSPGRTPCARST